MAENTYKTFLMEGTGSSELTWAKLCDIKDYPDLGGSPEQLETTTLTDKMQTFILGIQKTDSMEFTCNYDKTTYNTLKGKEGSDLHLAVWFGGTESGSTVTPTGSNGKFTFDGSLTVHVTGKGVNEVREMVVSIAASSVITFSTPS